MHAGRVQDGSKIQDVISNKIPLIAMDRTGGAHLHG